MPRNSTPALRTSDCWRTPLLPSLPAGTRWPLSQNSTARSANWPQLSQVVSGKASWIDTAEVTLKTR
jgi:hypothetical protein